MYRISDLRKVTENAWWMELDLKATNLNPSHVEPSVLLLLRIDLR